MVTQHRLTSDEAEIIVVLAAALHDLGLAVHTDPQLAAMAGLVLADRKLGELLVDLYAPRERAIVRVEALHAVAAQGPDAACLTLEAAVLKLADALDLTKGRARLPAEAAQRLGAANAMALVDEVTIQRAKTPPVAVVVRLSRLDGLAALAALLQSKLARVPLGGLVALAARADADRPGELQPISIWAENAD